MSKTRQAPIIAVVIPAYRAEKHISEVLRGIPEMVSHIIVVDDASSDNTVLLVKEAAQFDARIHLVRHAENRGVGCAMLSGYQAALKKGAEIVIKMDSDGQMDPIYIPELVAPILVGEADYTKGNRFLHSRQLLSMPLSRRLGNLGLSFLTKAASGYWKVFDPTNGYTALHTALIPHLDPSTIDPRYFFESSLLIELSLVNAAVKDVPIPAIYKGEKSNLSEFEMLFYYPPRLLRGFFKRIWVQYFIRDFNLASVFFSSGAFLFLFGLIFGSYHWIKNASLNILTPTGTIMLAVLPIILGVQFLVQAVALDVQNSPRQAVYPQLRHPDSQDK